MFAVILAGGAGTRLRPLTYARRKELIPLLNRPLLTYRLLNLRHHGIVDIVLACSQGMREVEEHFGDGASLGVRLRYVYEDRPLGSGRAVKEAALAAGAQGTLVVCNGDILTDLDLTAMIARHRETGATLSISLAAVDDPWHFGVVAVDDDLRIRHFVEKPPQGEEPSKLINAGTWLWEPAVLDRIPDDESAVRDGFSERVLFPAIIAAGERVQGFVEDLWVDVGSPERYLRATRLLLERSAGVAVEPGANVDPSAQLTGDVLVGAGAKIGAGARISGPAVIGPLTEIGRDTTIEASVVWEEARIGAGARVLRSILGAYAGVGDRAVVEDAILGNGAEVEEGHRLEPGARLMPGDRA
ncbi:MAG TPA: NDP-sugar synthase [Dehalococcoidia bacterium]|nr:NDP-sugar synthase [Dehalococcoidia bacterium]